MQLIILSLSLFIYYIMFVMNNPYEVIQFSIVFQLILVIGYTYSLIKSNIKKGLLIPYSMFYYVFFVYSIFGQTVWLYRDIYWFNEIGDPIPIIKIYGLVGIILYTFGISRNTYIKSKINNKYSVDTHSFSLSTINISGMKILLIFILGIAGTFIFTSGFKYIPLLSQNMSQTRLELQESNIGGKGFGFIFMLGLVNGIVFLYFKYKSVKSVPKKILYFVLIIAFYLPLTFYTGRLLLLIPFLIILLINLLQKQKINYLYFTGIITVIIVTYYMVMYFGAVRFFGNNVSSELIARYFWGDIFPEFRMFVYFNKISENNLTDVVYGTFFSGLIPGFIYNLVGIDKAEFYITIGKYVQSHMGNLGINLGIRLTLFGELYMAGGMISLISSLAVILVVIHILDIKYQMEKIFSTNKYIYLVMGIFMALSIPYGTLFLTSTIQFYFYTYFILKYVKI